MIFVEIAAVPSLESRPSCPPPSQGAARRNSRRQRGGLSTPVRRYGDMMECHRNCGTGYQGRPVFLRGRRGGIPRDQGPGAFHALESCRIRSGSPPATRGTREHSKASCLRSTTPRATGSARGIPAVHPPKTLRVLGRAGDSFRASRCEGHRAIEAPCVPQVLPAAPPRQIPRGRSPSSEDEVAPGRHAETSLRIEPRGT
jgi:hypothetical protein